MDDETLNRDDLIRVYRLDRTIRFARVRCLPRDQVLKRAVAMENEEFDAYVYRLRELTLSSSELEYIVCEMTKLATTSEEAPPEVKLNIDRGILRLVHILPTDVAYRFAEPFLDHPRKTRRKWAYAALRGRPISSSAAERLVRIFRETGDKSTLPFIAVSPECVQALGANFLLRKLNTTEQGYLRARVLETMLRFNREGALTLSPQYPWEFVYAAGRRIQVPTPGDPPARGFW